MEFMNEDWEKTIFRKIQIGDKRVDFGKINSNKGR